MHIDRYRQPDGSYIGPDGCTYKDQESLIQIAILGFCGCGETASFQAYIREFLQYLADVELSVFRPSSVPLPGDSDMERLLAWYVLDHLDLTEHGGIVTHSWLTEKGRELLDDLTELATL